MLVCVIYFIIKERKKSENLLLKILPKPIAKRLKKNEYPIADQFNNVSVLFLDIAGYTAYSANRKPTDLVGTLNGVFTKFDVLCKKHGLEKIKTMGDSYMAAAGVPKGQDKHAVCVANMALDIVTSFSGFKMQDNISLNLRIGLHCGAVVAGVIGKNKFIYDLWGDAVNTASRMESMGEIGKIQCTDSFKDTVLSQAENKEKYQFELRGKINVKGKGKIRTWFLSSVSHVNKTNNISTTASYTSPNTN